ncbi:hypothetical protein, partial [Yoonia sp. 67]
MPTDMPVSSSLELQVVMVSASPSTGKFALWVSAPTFRSNGVNSEPWLNVCSPELLKPLSDQLSYSPSAGQYLALIKLLFAPADRVG